MSVRLTQGAQVDPPKFRWYNGSMGYTGEQKREYQRKWVATRRAEYLADKRCVVCGSINELEIDHIDRTTKKYNPAALWGMSNTNPNKIAELKKCQVLCAVHHKEKTKAELNRLRTHGRTMYRYGCKCEICVEAQRQHNRQRYSPDEYEGIT